MISISFIIPCYNGEKFIFFNIKKIVKKITSLKINYEIIIINDGSSDKTLLKINKLQNIYKKIKFINFTKNRGKSFSIRKGLKLSKYNYIVLIDADLPYFLYIDTIILELKKKKDLVLVDRNHKNSILKNKNLSFYSYSRQQFGLLISKIIFYILRINLGLIDTQAGLKGFKKIKNFNKIKFISNKFFFDIELIHSYRILNRKISLIPVNYKLADNENSTINLFSLKNILIFIDFIKVIIFLKFR